MKCREEKITNENTKKIEIVKYERFEIWSIVVDGEVILDCLGWTELAESMKYITDGNTERLIFED